VIGTEQFRYLVLSISLIDEFRGIPEDVMNMNSYWRHSIACGLVSKKLAGYKEDLNKEKHFMFGMLSRYWAFDHVHKYTQPKLADLRS
jgi:hypothetical protein